MRAPPLQLGVPLAILLAWTLGLPEGRAQSIAPLEPGEATPKAPASGETNYGGDLANEPPELEEPHTHRYITKERTLSLPTHIDALSLTVSGGVSLGAYEAGQLYMLTEALRRSPGAARLLITAGTSAGSANALIAATDGCTKRGVAPEDSLGYRLWVPVGLGELFSPDDVTTESLFRLGALRDRIEILFAAWKNGLPSDCEFVASVAATRAEALEVSIADGLVVPRQSERFTLHLKARENSTPELVNYLDPSRNFDRPLLPLSDGVPNEFSTDIESIEHAVLASAAFPIAFPPQRVPHCLSERAPPNAPHATTPPRCRLATRNDAFVDGGVFDNNPLGISLRLANNGLYKDASGQLHFRPVPTGGNEPRAEVLHVFVDPDLRRYPEVSENEENDAREDPLLTLMGKLGLQVLSSMRGQELTSQAERNIGALGRLWLIRSSAPPMSNLLGAFFGFFEKDFRDFDFHLGSYDTFAELRSKTGTALGTDPFIGALTENLRDHPDSIDLSRRKMACIAAHYEPERFGGLRRYCDGKDLANFRILLQVSLDRLWSNCRRESLTDSERAQHELCGKAQLGAPSPVVDPTFAVEGPRYQSAAESDLDYALRLLGDYHFEFRDLGLRREEADEARIAIRRKLETMVTALADKQEDFTARTLLLTAGRMAVNSIAYEPPKRRVYVQLGTSLAVGYLGRLADVGSFFLNPDLRATHLDGLWTDRSYTFAGTASLGFEFLFLPLSDYAFQLSFGARAGYQITGNDDAGAKECTALASFDDSRNCSQFVVHSPLNATVLERIRLSVTPNFYPLAESFGHRVFDLEVGIGAELF